MRHPGVDRAHQLHQLVVHDLDELLARRNRPEDFFADGLLGDLVDEILYTLKLTSASSSASLTSRIASAILASR